MVKGRIPSQFIKQFFFILFNFRKADAFVCHFAGYSSFLPSILGRILGKPCLIIVAGNDGGCFPSINYGNYRKQPLRWVTGSSLRFATHILPVHESLVYQEYNYFEGGAPAQGYQYFVPDTSKVPFSPVYYGYETEFFKPIPGIDRRKNSFVSIGNLAIRNVFLRKGFDLIIELARRKPEWSFTIVGGSMPSELSIPKNLVVLPFCSVEEIVKILSEHEFYFQLSIMEGFPNALAEAMLCGCIPIGSNVSGIPYMIQDTGHILHHRNIDELEVLCEKAVSNERNTELSKRARQRIESEFTYAYRRDALSALIDRYTK